MTQDLSFTIVTNISTERRSVLEIAKKEKKKYSSQKSTIL